MDLVREGNEGPKNGATRAEDGATKRAADSEAAAGAARGTSSAGAQAPTGKMSAGSAAGTRTGKARRMDEDYDSDEERAYEVQARQVAEKVQRQQEGLETALLAQDHKDEAYRTVDEIQRLVEEQRQSVSATSSSRLSWSTSNSGKAKTNQLLGHWYTERSKFIPLRLEYKEREHLRRVMAVMRSCDYTNLVDGLEHKSRARRLNQQLQCIRAVLMGVATTFNYELAKGLLLDYDFAKYKSTFCKIFEIARRYKVMNPEKMRGLYGKMVFLLQDATTEAVRSDLAFDMVHQVQTVYTALNKINALDALQSEWISTATMEILPDGKSRAQIQKEIRLKEQAIEAIARKFGGSRPEQEVVKRCLYSIADNSSYLNSNCKPIDYVIDLLKTHFGQPEAAKSRWSLAIYGGADGSRLTHSHERQYHYVLQSLSLWREIVHDMFRLWYVAERDLLDSGNPYKLKNTGQGFNRLQAAPRTSKAMHGILYAVQQRLGHTVEGWVGSSVIHLGDTNVPNALVFIDKYNQVPRILNPIVQCLKYLTNHLVKDEELVRLVDRKFGSVEDAIRAILHDFFRRAFDGSGADNFFEAGSCIDGRLTSAWNWCQELPSKDYYFLFKLSGFLSFDGDFR